MHADKEYLGQIPIIYPNAKILGYIIKLVESINLQEKSDIKEITRKIDEYVFKLYNVSDNDKNIISNAIDNHMSIKSRW